MVGAWLLERGSSDVSMKCTASFLHTTSALCCSTVLSVLPYCAEAPLR
jgi:hypothetical protein